MAIRNAITLTDAALPPVNRIYQPFKSDGDTIHWRDRTQAIAVGQNRLSLNQRMAGKNAATNKFSWRLEAPVLAVSAPTTSTGIQPAPSVAYTNLASLELVLHERSSLQERKDILAQLRDLIDEAIMTNLVESYDVIF